MSQPQLSLASAFKAGALTGVIGGVAAVATGLAMTAVTGKSYEPVPVPAMFIASVVLTLLGTPVYWQIARRAANPATAWLMVSAVVVTLYSLAQVWNPQLAPFEGAVSYVNTMHVVVGLVVGFGLPRLAGRFAGDA